MRKVLLGLLLFLAGCVTDPSEKTNNGGGDPLPRGMAEVVLRLKVPGDAIPAPTRGLTFPEERTIDPDKIWVMLLDTGDNFVEIKKVDDLTDTGVEGPYSFTVKVAPTPIGQTTRLVLLANITQAEADIIENASVGTGYAAITELLNRTLTGKLFTDANSGLIPMWGETQPLQIAAGSQSETVNMLRAIARIDVGVGQMTPAPRDPNTGTGGETDATHSVWDGLNGSGDVINFKLDEVYVVRPSNGYRIMPVLGNVRPDYKSSALSLPVGGVGKFDVATSESTFAYTGADIADDLYTTRSIYVPEADVVMNGTGKVGDVNHENRMAVVVGGRYNGSSTTSYYRIDFANGENLQNVLRNHLYSFSIQGVKGDGYPTVEAAYKSISTNLIVDVLDWDEEIYDEIYFDGIYYFAIDRREFLFGPMPGETLVMNIRTNFPQLDFARVTAPGANPIKLTWDEDPSTPNQLVFNSDRGYVSTLWEDPSPDPLGGKHLTLSVYNPTANIGLPARSDAEVLWEIMGGRLNIGYKIDQENDPDGWESFENGQHDYVMPEGTTAGQLPIQVVSTSLPKLAVMTDDATSDELYRWENGAAQSTPDAWAVVEGDVASGTSYHLFDGEIVVQPYKLDGTNTPPTRTATLTITWDDPSHSTYKQVKYQITQEAPRLDIVRDLIYAQRPVAGNSTQTVQVFTNIMLGDLRLTQVSGTPDMVVSVAGLEAGYDPRNPRYAQFNVEIDMSNASIMEGVFKVESNGNNDYGDLLPDEVTIRVPAFGSEVFRMFWQMATFAGGRTWTPSTLEFTSPIRTNPSSTADIYFFPWNTTNIAFEAESNVGFEADPANTSLGTATMSSITENGTNFTWNVTLNNADYSDRTTYQSGFRSEFKDGTDTYFLAEESFTFRQGRQLWERTTLPSDGELSYDGVWPGTNSDYVVSSASVRWTAATTFPGTEKDFVKISAQQDGETATTPALTVDVDDRLYEPKMVPSAGDPADYMIKNTTLRLIVDPWTALNPATNTREAKVTFTNTDYDVSKLGASAPQAITVTQWGRILKKFSFSLSAQSILPADGQVPIFSCDTNIPEFVVKAYDVTKGTGDSERVLISTTTHSGPQVISTTNPTRTTAAAINSTGMVNTSPQRRLVQFVLSAPGLTYADECLTELNFGTWEQEAATGFALAPPGVLGVSTETGTLTMRGSKEFAGTSYENDSPTGTVFPETVNAVFFKWGSLVAISNVVQPNGSGGFTDTFATDDVVWTPTGYATTINGWGDIQHAASWPASNDLSTGIGDPCTLADGGIANWRMPEADNATASWGGYTAGQFLPVTGTVGGVAVSGLHKHTNATFGASAARVFLPFGGTRDEQGTFRQAYHLPNRANFWSRTFTTSVPTSLGISPNTASNRHFVPSADQNIDNALMIRCVYVPPVVVPRTGVPAPPGTLGVTVSGALTLKGSNHYAGTSIEGSASAFGGLSSEEVYVAYFKWGSLIATSSNTNPGDTFDETDIIWAPSGYDIDALRDRVKNATGNNKWGEVKAATGNSFPGYNPTAGLGDPCYLADEGDTYSGVSTYHMLGQSPANPGSPQMLQVGIAEWGPTAGRLTNIWTKTYTQDNRALVFTGQRNMTTGAMEDVKATGGTGSGMGYYWLTYHNGTNPNALTVQGAWSGTNGYATNLNNGFAIRCVQ